MLGDDMGGEQKFEGPAEVPKIQAPAQSRIVQGTYGELSKQLTKINGGDQNLARVQLGALDQAFKNRSALPDFSRFKPEAAALLDAVWRFADKSYDQTGPFPGFPPGIGFSSKQLVSIANDAKTILEFRKIQVPGEKYYLVFSKDISSIEESKIARLKDWNKRFDNLHAATIALGILPSRVETVNGKEVDPTEIGKRGIKPSFMTFQSVDGEVYHFRFARSLTTEEKRNFQDGLKRWDIGKDPFSKVAITAGITPTAVQRETWDKKLVLVDPVAIEKVPSPTARERRPENYTTRFTITLPKGGQYVQYVWELPKRITLEQRRVFAEAIKNPEKAADPLFLSQMENIQQTTGYFIRKDGKQETARAPRKETFTETLRGLGVTSIAVAVVPKKKTSA